MFPKFIPNCTCLPSFTMWIFFSKILWRFQYNIHFFPFLVVLRENLWKTYQFYDLFSKLLWLCARSQNFVIKKFLLKKWQLFQNAHNFLFISETLSNICDKTYEKTYSFFLHILKVPLHFYIFPKFGDRNLEKKWHLFQYVNKSFLIPATLNNILAKNYEKFFNSCNVLFKFVSIFTLSRSFIMTTLLQ